MITQKCNKAKLNCLESRKYVRMSSMLLCLRKGLSNKISSQNENRVTLSSNYDENWITMFSALNGYSKIILESFDILNDYYAYSLFFRIPFQTFS